MSLTEMLVDGSSEAAPLVRFLPGVTAFGFGLQVVLLAFAWRAYVRTKRLQRMFVGDDWSAIPTPSVPSRLLELCVAIPPLLVATGTVFAVQRSRELIIQGVTSTDPGHRAGMLSAGLQGELTAIVIGLVGVTLPLLLGSVAVGLAASARRLREGLVWATELAKRDRPTASAWAACPGSSAYVLIAAFLAFILLGLGPVVWAGLSGTWLELRTLSRIASEAPAAKIALFGEAERAAVIMLERGYVAASLGAVCAALGSGLLLWFASPARARLRILGRPVSEPPPSRSGGVAVVVFLAAGALFTVARPMKRENDTPWPTGGVNDALPAETPQLEGPDSLEVGPVVELTPSRISVDRAPQGPGGLEARLREYRRNFPLLYPGASIPQSIVLLCSPETSRDRVFATLGGVLRSGYDSAVFALEIKKEVVRPVLGAVTLRHASAARTSLSVAGAPPAGAAVVRSDDAPNCGLLAARIVSLRRNGRAVVLVVPMSAAESYQPGQE